MLEEHIFLNENDVIVNNVRLVFDEDETYALSGINVVRLEKGKRQGVF
jgi:hypothetical protein